MTRSAIVALVSALALSTPTVAQQTSGSITGEVALDPAEWHVTGDGDSGWQREGNEVVVRIVGEVLRDAKTETDGTLTITYRTSGNPTQMEVENFTIRLEPDGDAHPYSAGPENATLEVESQIVSGDGMSVNGSFTGRLVPGGAEKMVLDDDEVLRVDGNFQATLQEASLDGADVELSAD